MLLIVVHNINKFDYEAYRIFEPVVQLATKYGSNGVHAKRKEENIACGNGRMI